MQHPISLSLTEFRNLLHSENVSDKKVKLFLQGKPIHMQGVKYQRHVTPKEAFEAYFQSAEKRIYLQEKVAEYYFNSSFPSVLQKKTFPLNIKRSLSKKIKTKWQFIKAKVDDILIKQFANRYSTYFSLLPISITSHFHLFRYNAFSEKPTEQKFMKFTNFYKDQKQIDQQN